MTVGGNVIAMRCVAKVSWLRRSEALFIRSALHRLEDAHAIDQAIPSNFADYLPKLFLDVDCGWQGAFWDNVADEPARHHIYRMLKLEYLKPITVLSNPLHFIQAFIDIVNCE